MVLDFGRRFIRLHLAMGPQRLGQFVVLGVNSGTVSDHELVKRALLVYVDYRASNAIRRGSPATAEDAHDMLQQFRIHTKATRKRGRGRRS